MIKRLKTRYIALALSALFVLLAFIVIGMNLLNYRAVAEEADTTLFLLSQNQGVFPNYEEAVDDWLPSGMSPEIPFESRFFSVLVNKDGDVVYTETSQIYSINDTTAGQYAKESLEERRDRGFVGSFRYIRYPETDGTRITFLDCGRKLGLYRDFATFSIGMALLGYVMTAVLVCFFAGRFIRPVAESYEKQKRFITDAGHEIKTPLTIISADVDALIMDLGENDYLDDIGRQTKRLAGLTNDLVYLARMEEADTSTPMIAFPVSEIVLETAASFQALAQAQNKELSLQVQPLLSMVGADKAISQLVSILLDNALKYSPADSRIVLRFEKNGRKLALSVKNLSSIPLADEDLQRVFDRFYRADRSRNSETGGHGIGLSMAQAIVSAHNGKIAASSPDGASFLVTAVFPS